MKCLHITVQKLLREDTLPEEQLERSRAKTKPHRAFPLEQPVSLDACISKRSVGKSARTERTPHVGTSSFKLISSTHFFFFFSNRSFIFPSYWKPAITRLTSVLRNHWTIIIQMKSCPHPLEGLGGIILLFCSLKERERRFPFVKTEKLFTKEAFHTGKDTSRAAGLSLTSNT